MRILLWLHTHVPVAVLGAVLLLMSFFTVQVQAAAVGPMSALETAQKSVDTADSTLFTNAVDVDSVITKAADTLIAALRQEVMAGNISNSTLAMTLTLLDAADTSGQRALIMPLLMSEVKSFLAAGINGGYFAGKPNGAVRPSSVSLASVLDKMPEGRRSIVPGSIISEKDGAARVSATFVDPGTGRLPLVLDLQRQGADWRVTEIVNASDLFKDSIRKK